MQVEELLYEDYLLLLRDAVIYAYSQTEKGREYLADCWRMTQTEPDIDALRQRYKE